METVEDYLDRLLEGSLVAVLDVGKVGEDVEGLKKTINQWKQQ